MMRKSMVASGFIVAAVALLIGTIPTTAEARSCCRRCGYSSCGSSCGYSSCGYSSCGSSCYSGCSTCYQPSSCGTCYTACAPTCAPSCTTSCCTTSCAPACSTCYAPSSCCGNGYYYSYRAPFTPTYVVSGGRTTYYYTSAPVASAPVATQRTSVIATPVRYEARRTSLFGW